MFELDPTGNYQSVVGEKHSKNSTQKLLLVLHLFSNNNFNFIHSTILFAANKQNIKKNNTLQLHI